MDVEIKVKRVYETTEERDGVRFLVDRLWPRGVAREKAQVDHWARVMTPSHELRKKFHTDLRSEEEFAELYRTELSDHVSEIRELLGSQTARTITLLTATKDPKKGHVAILTGFLQSTFPSLTIAHED